MESERGKHAWLWLWPTCGEDKGSVESMGSAGNRCAARSKRWRWGLVATDGEKARSVLGTGCAYEWALAILSVAHGPLKPGGVHCSNGPAQFPRLNILFQLFQTTSSLQNTKVVCPALQNFLNITMV
jgi:hypothetical protein